MKFFSTLRAGMRYMESWPDEPVLGAVFPESRVKYVMRWGRRLIPPFIVLIVLWTFIRGGGLSGVSFFYTIKINYPMTVMCVLFLLCMPLQGYYWFGRRAQLPLSAKQKLFYTNLCYRLQTEPVNEPTMADLAKAINDGLKRLDDKEFLKEL